MKDESYPGEADEAARDEASCHEPHMAHTPGPWGMPDSGKGLVSKKTPDGWDGMIASADCGDYARSRTEGLANARLIAAAPELLEALKGCLDIAVRYASQHDYSDTATERILCNASAAIAKATGAL